MSFVISAVPVRSYTKKTGSEHCRERSSKLSKGIFHTPEHHAWYRNWGKLPGKGTGLGSGRGVWSQSACGVQFHRALLACFCFIIIIIIIFIIIYFISILYFIFSFQLLNNSYLDIQVLLWFSSKYHYRWGGEIAEQVALCCLIFSWA